MENVNPTKIPMHVNPPTLIDCPGGKLNATTIFLKENILYRKEIYLTKMETKHE